MICECCGGPFDGKCLDTISGEIGRVVVFSAGVAYRLDRVERMFGGVGAKTRGQVVPEGEYVLGKLEFIWSKP